MKENLCFEQYKLEVEMADRTTQRRYTFNSILITLHVAIMGGIVKLTIEELYSYSLFVSMLGIVLSIIWYLQIYNFQKMTKIKFDIIKEIEATFDKDLKKVYTKTHDIRDNYEKNTNFIKFSTLEKFIAIIFLIIYISEFLFFSSKTIIIPECMYYFLLY